MSSNEAFWIFSAVVALFAAIGLYLKNKMGFAGRLLTCIFLGVITFALAIIDLMGMITFPDNISGVVIVTLTTAFSGVVTLLCWPPDFLGMNKEEAASTENYRDYHLSE